MSSWGLSSIFASGANVSCKLADTSIFARNEIQLLSINQHPSNVAGNFYCTRYVTYDVNSIRYINSARRPSRGFTLHFQLAFQFYIISTLFSELRTGQGNLSFSLTRGS